MPGIGGTADTDLRRSELASRTALDPKQTSLRCTCRTAKSRCGEPRPTGPRNPRSRGRSTGHPNIDGGTDHELLAVWLKGRADGWPHTIRVCSRVRERFLAALATAGSNLRQATAEDVHSALEAIRSKENYSSPRVRIGSSAVTRPPEELFYALLVLARLAAQRKPLGFA